MYIVDGHCDSIEKVASSGYNIVNPYNYSRRHLQLQFVAAFIGWPKDTPEQCYDRAMRYVGHFACAMAGEADKVVQVKTYADIEAAFASGRHAALFTEEGGTGIMGDPKKLRDLYNFGLRVFGLAWLSNDLARSNRTTVEEDTGLTDLGREIVAVGNELGLIFDVSHLSDKSFYDLIEIADKPVVATHSNFRALCGHSRNLTDDMAKRLVERDGMIGLNLCTSFIHEDDDKKTVDSLFAHLDHGIELTGEDHIGFGCDIDGIDGIYPSPLTEEDSIHDQIIELMLRHNYPETLIEKVAGGNWLAYLKKYL